MADEFGRALHRLLARRRHPVLHPLAEPSTAFEVVLAQRVTRLEREVDELRGRVFGLVLLVAGGVLAQLVSRLL